MQHMRTPEKERFMEVKESLKKLDCEVHVELQGFEDTYDEDDDLDDNTVAVGTTSESTTIQELIKQIAEEDVVKRKVEKPRTLRLWVPRNMIYNGYKAKDSITKTMRVSDCDGYGRKQVYAFITTDPNGPTLPTEADTMGSGGITEEKGPEETRSARSGYDTANPPQDTPPATPKKPTQGRESPEASQSSKRQRTGGAEPATAERGPGAGDDMDLEEDGGFDLLNDQELAAAMAELAAQERMNQDGTGNGTEPTNSRPEEEEDDTSA